MAELKHPEEESLENKPWCWTTVQAQGNAPCQRSLHTGVVLENAMFVFGGYDGVQRTNDFYRFSFSNFR